MDMKDMTTLASAHPVRGMIFSIIRASLHDGPGVRTVVYFKGCPLRCLWCHNPEGLQRAPELQYYPDKCIGCGRCHRVCPEHHIDGAYVRAGCSGCGRCAAVCPSETLVLCGRVWTTDALVAELGQDKPYFDRSGGGVTFSGGECFLQPAFLAQLNRRCHAAGIRTAAETSLYFARTHLDIACEIDSMLVDLKHMGDAAHKAYTGVSNRRILDNLIALSHRHTDVTVRIPLIPYVNDGEENLRASAEFLNTCGPGIRQVELLPYNDLAGSKYTALGYGEGRFFGEPQSAEVLRKKRELMRGGLRETITVKGLPY